MKLFLSSKDRCLGGCSGGKSGDESGGSTSLVWEGGFTVMGCLNAKIMKKILKKMTSPRPTLNKNFTQIYSILE